MMILELGLGVSVIDNVGIVVREAIKAMVVELQLGLAAGQILAGFGGVVGLDVAIVDMIAAGNVDVAVVVGMAVVVGVVVVGGVVVVEVALVLCEIP